MIEEPETPELDKLSSVSKERQEIGQFLEWATSEGGYNFTKTVTLTDERPYLHKEGTYTVPMDFEQPVSIEEALAHYFDIDLMKVEQERRAVLDFVRAKTEGS